MAVGGAGGSPNIQLIQPDTLGSPSQDVESGEAVVSAESSYAHIQQTQKSLQAIAYIPEGMSLASARLGSVQDKSSVNILGMPSIPMEKVRRISSQHRSVVAKMKAHAELISNQIQGSMATAFHKVSMDKVHSGMETMDLHVSFKNALQVKAAAATGN